VPIPVTHSLPWRALGLEPLAVGSGPPDEHTPEHPPPLHDLPSPLARPFFKTPSTTVTPFLPTPAKATRQQHLPGPASQEASYRHAADARATQKATHLASALLPALVAGIATTEALDPGSIGAMDGVATGGVRGWRERLAARIVGGSMPDRQQASRCGAQPFQGLAT
jgi:hypothetical protein